MDGKKINLFVYFLICTITFGQSDYYQGTEGLIGNALKAKLHSIIKNHIRYPYTSTGTDVWEILQDTDEDPENPDNVILLYTGRSQAKAYKDQGDIDYSIYDNGNGTWDNAWNREHVWPKSHGFPEETDTAYTDIHHLRPADKTVNSSRGTKDFDEGGFPQGEADDTFTDSDSWEPMDAVKGDIARMIFYMIVRYEGYSGYNLELVDYTGTDEGSSFLGKLSTLRAWHSQDPVDSFEAHRNEVIYSYQQNRNPFIDHPEFVELLYSNLPNITLSTDSLSFFNYLINNGPSSSISFSISGSNLISDVTITLPASYELSTDNVSFSNDPINIAPVSGELSNTLIYIRLKSGLIAGTYNENISITTDDVPALTVDCVGEVELPFENPHVYINEIRTDDTSTDDIEFIELIGPAGTDITGYKIEHYNGNETSDGAVWSLTISSFTIPDDGITDSDNNSVGFFVIGATSVANVDQSVSWQNDKLQNGPDGIILYNDRGNILDAIAWGNTGDMLIDDPATVSAAVSTDEGNYLHTISLDDNTDNSLQAPDDVHTNTGSGWIVDIATPGGLNINQTTGGIALPVELISFTAAAADSEVKLSWSTATEVNNYGFEIERNTVILNWENINGIEWEKIGFVEGCGNSNSLKEYSYVDKTVNSYGVFSYRLKQIDMDGKYNYSEILKVNISIQPNYFELSQNYPNPFNPSTIISFSIPKDARVKLYVYNLLGEVVAKLVDDILKAGQHEIEWNKNSGSGNLSSGVYFYKLQTDDFSATRKMILMK